MKIDLSKKEKIWFVAIGIGILSLTIVFTQFSLFFSFENTGEIGDTIGGITAPFMSFFGSILVYLALKSQIDANTEFKRQFERQYEDQLFFRLFENLHSRINNNVSTSNSNSGEIIQGYNSLSFLVDEFKKHMENETRLFGRHLLAKNPELIDFMYYRNIVSNYFSQNNLTEAIMFDLVNERAEELKSNLIDLSYCPRDHAWLVSIRLLLQNPFCVWWL